MKKPAKKLSAKIPPVETGDGRLPFEDSEINTYIAFYNRSGNALALWDVFRLCLQYDRPLPAGAVKEFFAFMADEILEYSSSPPDKETKIRQAVADLVLGTSKSGGGPSVFPQYKNFRESRALYYRIDASVMKRLFQSSSKSLAKVYEEVAAELGISFERTQKIHQEGERGNGWSASDVRKALVKGRREASGIIDL